MLLHLPHILAPAEIAQARQSLRDDAPWLAGGCSAGLLALVAVTHTSAVSTTPLCTVA